MPTYPTFDHDARGELVLDLPGPVNLGRRRTCTGADPWRIVVTHEQAWIKGCAGDAGCRESVVPVVGRRSNNVLSAIEHRQPREASRVLAATDAALQVVVAERPSDGKTGSKELSYAANQASTRRRSWVGSRRGQSYRCGRCRFVPDHSRRKTNAPGRPPAAGLGAVGSMVETFPFASDLGSSRSYRSSKVEG